MDDFTKTQDKIFLFCLSYLILFLMFLNFFITLNVKHIYFNLTSFYKINIFFNNSSKNLISYDVINAYEELQIFFYIYYFLTFSALMFQLRLLNWSLYLTVDGLR